MNVITLLYPYAYDLFFTHFYLGMVEEFEQLFNRKDIQAIIVECDTTFNIGNYFVTWVNFRHTEFYDLPDNPMPTVG